MAKDKLVAYADALEACLDVQAELEEQLAPYKAEEEKLRAEIVASLLKSGLDWCRTSSGLSFGLVDGKTSFPIKEGREQEAIAYAQKNYPATLSIAMAKWNKIMKPLMELPDFVERRQAGKHLSVRTVEDND